MMTVFGYTLFDMIMTIQNDNTFTYSQLCLLGDHQNKLLADKSV